jgi:hypothetical protein
LKIYQIKYTHFGTVKYCYTDNFTDFYANYPEVQTKQNRLELKKEFYQKVWTYQQTILQNGQKQTLNVSGTD